MADTNKTAEDQEFLDDGFPNPEYKEPEAGGEEGDIDPNKKDDGEGEGAPAGDEDDPVIPVRKSVASHIITRQKKTIQKLKSKTEEDGGGEEGGEGGGETELTPDARTAISEEVGNRIKPVLDTMASTADEDELKDLYANEPEAKKLDKKIRTYMASPHYKGVPPAVIYHHLAFGDAEIEGARKGRVADKEADQTIGGGRTIRPKGGDTGNIPSVEEQANMSDEDFENLEHKARTGEFLSK